MSLHKDQQLKVHVCSWLDRVVVCLVDVAPQRSAAQGTRVFLAGSCRISVRLADVASERRGNTAKIILLCSYYFFRFSVSI